MEKDKIENMLKEYLADALKVEEDEIETDTSFFKLGVSSVQALKVINKVRKKLDIEVNPVAMFEFKCISDLAEYLSKCVEEQK